MHGENWLPKVVLLPSRSLSLLVETCMQSINIFKNICSPEIIPFSPVLLVKLNLCF